MPQPLDARASTVSRRSDLLTDLIAAAMAREAGPADAVLFESGAIGLDEVLPAGPVTQYDVIRLLPSGTRVMKATFDGASLGRLLDAGLQATGTGGYLQTSGLGGSSGARLIGGRPLEPTRRYTIALTASLFDRVRADPGVREVERFRDLRRPLIDEIKTKYGT